MYAIIILADKYHGAKCWPFFCFCVCFR